MCLGYRSIIFIVFISSFLLYPIKYAHSVVGQEQTDRNIAMILDRNFRIIDGPTGDQGFVKEKLGNKRVFYNWYTVSGKLQGCMTILNTAEPSIILVCSDSLVNRQGLDQLSVSDDLKLTGEQRLRFLPKLYSVFRYVLEREFYEAYPQGQSDYEACLQIGISIDPCNQAITKVQSAESKLNATTTIHNQVDTKIHDLPAFDATPDVSKERALFQVLNTLIQKYQEFSVDLNQAYEIMRDELDWDLSMEYFNEAKNATDGYIEFLSFFKSSLDEAIDQHAQEERNTEGAELQGLLDAAGVIAGTGFTSFQTAVEAGNVTQNQLDIANALLMNEAQYLLDRLDELGLEGENVYTELLEQKNNDSLTADKLTAARTAITSKEAELKETGKRLLERMAELWDPDANCVDPCNDLLLALIGNIRVVDITNAEEAILDRETELLELRTGLMQRMQAVELEDNTAYGELVVADNSNNDRRITQTIIDNAETLVTTTEAAEEQKILHAAVVSTRQAANAAKTDATTLFNSKESVFQRHRTHIEKNDVAKNALDSAVTGMQTIDEKSNFNQLNTASEKFSNAASHLQEAADEAATRAAPTGGDDSV